MIFLNSGKSPSVKNPMKTKRNQEICKRALLDLTYTDQVLSNRLLFSHAMTSPVCLTQVQ